MRALRILVVEDDPKLRGLVRRALQEQSFAVDVAANGEDGLWLATENPYDVLVLDVMLPDIDGFTVCTRLRARERWTPVLMLTARDAVEDRVRGLDVGADDYLVKPFVLAELVARLRALIRRGATPRPTVLVVGDLIIDPAARTVTRGGADVALTAREFALLHYLAAHAGESLSRDRLLAHVWDDDFDGDPHVVAVYIAYLRAKIDRPFGRRSLETVRGAGYRLCDELAAPAAR